MPVKPESMGMCSARLQRIDRFLAQRYVDSGRLPCALLQVSRGGQLVHQSVLGKASLESGAPLAEDSIVRIYSMTKPITSVAFMMLVEQGLVALDDPVHRYIPSWRNLGVYVAGGGGLPGTAPGWQTTAHRSADAHHRPAAPHLGPDLRLPVAHQRRRRLPAGQRRAPSSRPTASTASSRRWPSCRWSSRRARPGTIRSPPTCSATWWARSRACPSRVPEDAHPRAAGHDDTAFHVPSTGPSRLAQCYMNTPEGKLDAAACRSQLPSSRRSHPRAAAGWCPPPPTTCASVKRCAAAARSATSG